ncbi:hypothetical protein [Halomonas litopenaei]|uniref:hypothetical protein n=1 Tax=Halomonas litopenaei TaxID=2109328 RepID=UPI003F9F943E
MCRGSVAVAELTEALSTLGTAQEARADFLESTYESNEDVEDATTVAGDEPTADEIADGVEAVFDNSLTNGDGDGVNDLTDAAVGDLSADRSDAYNQALIDEQKSINDKAVSDAQETVDETDGLSTAVNTLYAAQTGYTEAVEAEAATKATLDGALATVNTANNAAGYTLVANIPTEGTSAAIVEDGGTQVIGFNADGDLEIASAYQDDERIDELFAAVQGEVSALLDQEDAEASLESSVADVVALEGTTELDGTEATTYFDTNADATVAASATGSAGPEGLFTDADGNLYVGVNASGTTGTLEATDTLHIVSDITVTPQTDGSLAVQYNYDATAADAEIGQNGVVAGDYTAVDASNTVSYTASDIDASNYLDLASEDTGYLDVEAGNDVIDFSADAADSWALISAQKAQDDFNAAVETYVEAKALADELEGFDDAVTEAREAIENDEADGGLGISLLEGADNFTVENDVYLFSGEAGTQDLANFGNNGQDKIFFGEEFSLVELGDDDITDNVGDSGAMEIFWEQQGNDLVLSVENEAFGGNSAGTADVTEITLAGVSADDVNFADGYLSAGTAA